VHYENPPQEPFKTREQQDEDFKTYFEPYADKNCPSCFGSAKNGYNTTTQMYVPCNCVLKNIHSTLAEQNKTEAGQDGILQAITKMFGIN
jgi:hypothetical protein